MVARHRVFHPLATVAAAAALIAVVTAFYHGWDTPLDRLARPEASLSRLVSREMELREALNRAPRWERAVHRMLGFDAEPLDEALEAYDELVQVEPSAAAALRRLVLRLEAGVDAGAGEEIARVATTYPGAEPAGRWLSAAYLEPADRQAAAQALEELASFSDPLLDGWFRDTLRRRLANRAGEGELGRQAEAAIRERGHMLLGRVRALSAAALVLTALSAVWLWRMRQERPRPEAPAALPPPWSAADGWGLFVWATLGYTAIPVAIGYLPYGMLVPDGALRLAAGLPVGALAWLCLRAYSAPVLPTLGLRAGRGDGPRLLGAAMVAFTVPLLVEAVVSRAVGALGVTAHWADGFIEDLVWGPPSAILAEVVDSGIWAPLVEEVIFRGFLYGTLRLHLSAWPAALASGSVFAAVHGYGLVGSIGIMLTGAVWALTYERTRSLLPGMLAHAATNLTVTALYVFLLRL